MSMPSVAVITGAASGIGLATTRALQEAGVTVAGVDLADLPTELQQMERVTWVRGDVCSQETWDRVMESCPPAGPDSLITCAAELVVAPCLETSLGDWRRLFESNVLGVVRGMQMVIPAMLERGRGTIAVVCSVNSLFVEQELSAYSTSKAALLHVVRSAALEYANKGLRINAICPGAVDTPLLRRHLELLDDPDSALRLAKRRSPTGQILRSEEVAAVACFLISDAASGLSGAAVTVDGGLTTTYDFDSER
jgi:NAD(P)-dependent dehydrogenase (short-subunit alcohol dehydrogenase family)